jgi:hypothetical protein
MLISEENGLQKSKVTISNSSSREPALESLPHRYRSRVLKDARKRNVPFFSLAQVSLKKKQRER